MYDLEADRNEQPMAVCNGALTFCIRVARRLSSEDVPGSLPFLPPPPFLPLCCFPLCLPLGSASPAAAVRLSAAAVAGASLQMNKHNITYREHNIFCVNCMPVRNRGACCGFRKVARKAGQLPLTLSTTAATETAAGGGAAAVA